MYLVERKVYKKKSKKSNERRIQGGHHYITVRQRDGQEELWS